MRLLMTVCIVALGCAGGSALAEIPQSAQGQLAQAKPATKPGKKAPGNWSLVCSNFASKKTNQCRIFQGFYLRKTRRLLLGVSVRTFKGTAQPVMVLRTPFGTHLPSGVTTKIDRHALKKTPYQTCNARGCFATVKVSLPMLSRLTSGRVMVVIYRNLKRQEFKFNVGLAGFKAAYGKMVAK
jgi:invasion protein IalB